MRFNQDHVTTKLISETQKQRFERENELKEIS